MTEIKNEMDMSKVVVRYEYLCMSKSGVFIRGEVQRPNDHVRHTTYSIIVA